MQKLPLFKALPKQTRLQFWFSFSTKSKVCEFFFKGKLAFLFHQNRVQSSQSTALYQTNLNSVNYKKENDISTLYKHFFILVFANMLYKKRLKKKKRVATQMPLSNLDNKNKTKNLNKNAL